MAGRQHGVVALAQLTSLGLSASAVRTRVASGRLHRIHRGIYAVGHPLLAREGRWMAAVLACGPGAALSHRAAAALWGLRPSSRPVIDVTAPRAARRRRAGIQTHRAGTIRPRDLTCQSGIPCTTVARTLLDLAGVVDRRSLERAVERAETLQVLDTRLVEDVLAWANGRHGAGTLRSVLGDYGTGFAPTRSELEERFLALCAAAGIPRPKVNTTIVLEGDAIEVDFLWPDQGLIAETDGHGVHGTRRAFERDRRRDQRLLLAGWRVARFTWSQLTRSRHEVAQTIAALLALPPDRDEPGSAPRPPG